MSLKGKRQLVAVAYYGAVLLVCLAGIGLGDALGSQNLAAFSALIALGHALTFRLNPLPWMIQERFIQDAECPACGEVIDLSQTWSCPCGYVSWETRHAFSPCPECKKVFRWLVCPRCDASIPI